MKTQYRYRRITESNYYAMRIYYSKYASFAFALLVILTLLTGENDDISRSVLIIVISLSYSLAVHLTYKPYDEILITDKALIIRKFKAKSTILQLQSISKIFSGTILTLSLKNGEVFKLNYSNWLLPLKEIKAMVRILEKYEN